VASRDQLKIFVGGLSQYTTKQSLDEYFNQFGYADSYIMLDRATGRSRGFGFVNFSERQVMDHVLSYVHEVDGVGVTTSPYSRGGSDGGSGSATASGRYSSRAAYGAPSAAEHTASAPVHSGRRGAKPAAPADNASSMTASLLSQVEEKLMSAIHNAVGQQQQSPEQQQHQKSQGPLKIFVGGLAPHTTKESLDAYFSAFGTADSYVMIDKASGRSRGFGFVNFTDEQALSTVLSFEHEVDGQVITTDKYEEKWTPGGRHSAKPKPEGGGKGAGAGGGTTTALGSTAVEILNNTIQMISKLRGQIESQAQPAPRKAVPRRYAAQQDTGYGPVKLFVGGLAPTTTSDELADAFAPYGCTETEVITDKYTGRSRGFGFVLFASSASADDAMQVQHVIEGRAVELSECWEKGSGKAKKSGGSSRYAPY